MLRRTFLGLVSLLLWPFGARAVARKPSTSFSSWAGLDDFRMGPWQASKARAYGELAYPARRWREGTARVVGSILARKGWDASNEPMILTAGRVRVREYVDENFDGKGGIESWLFLVVDADAVKGFLPCYRTFNTFDHLAD